MSCSQVNLASKGSTWKRLFDTSVAAASANWGTIVGKKLASPFADATNLKIISGVPIPTGEHPDFAAGGDEPNAIALRFLGTDTNNQTFSARVWGITKGIGSPSGSAVECWERVLLAQFLCTMGNIAGVANTLILASEFEVDTIALTYGAVQDIIINSPANDLPAWARVDIQGYPLIGIEFDDGGSAASCNGLYRFLW